MGTIRRLKDNELVGGTSDKYVYPITSSTAVYHDGKPLDEKLVEIEKEITGSGSIVKNNDITFEYGTKSTIATVAGVDITATMPESKDTSVVNNDITLSYGTKSTIAKVGDTDITLTMPAAQEIPTIDAVDFDVDTWGTDDDYNHWVKGTDGYDNKTSLAYAIGMSLKYNGTGIYTRIHIKNNLNISTTISLDTSMCEIDGGGNTIKLYEKISNAYTYRDMLISGSQFKISNTRIQRVEDNVVIEGDGLSNMKSIVLSDSELMTLVFDNITFFNFPLVSKPSSTTDIAYPGSFYFLKIDSSGSANVYNVLTKYCKFVVRPQRYSSTYAECFKNANYRDCIGLIYVSGLIGSFNLNMFNTIGSAGKTTVESVTTYKYTKGCQQFQYMPSKSSYYPTVDGTMISDGSSDFRVDTVVNGVASSRGSEITDSSSNDTNIYVWYGLTNKDILKLA